MTVHTQYNTDKKRLIALFLIIMLLAECLTSISVGAVNVGSYSGKYDLTKPHKVNQHYNPHKNILDEEYCDSQLQACYQQFLAWGVTEQGAAAMVGNFRAEGWVTDTTQDWVDWDNFSYGVTGIGLMGFTYYAIQDKLFEVAEKQGKQWTDLGVQLETIKEWYFPLSKKYYESGHTVEELSNDFCANYERPAVNNFGDRATYSKKYSKKFKSLKAKDYDGKLSTGGNNSNDSDSDNSVITAGGSAVEEWQLTGMPSKSGLTADLNIPTLAKRSDLTTNEQYNLASIGSDISRNSEYNAWTMARRYIVFAGLLMVVYTLLLALAFLFDSWNTFFSISLVKIMSLGVINYSKDCYALENGEKTKYVSGKRVIILLIVMFIIGCIFISGGVIPVVIQTMYKFMSMFNGGG